MATLKDIAQRAGISQGAVSRILNCDSTLSVSDSTRENVIKIAKELNYMPVSERYRKEKNSALGKGYMDDDKLIGVVQMFEMEELKEDIYYLVMKNVLDSVCFARGWNTVQLYRDENGRFIKNNDQKLDGIVGIGRFNEKEINNLEEYTPNLVFIDSSPDEMKYYSIVSNYHMAVRLILNHFHEMGYEKIAYLGSVRTYNGKKILKIDPRYYYYKNALNDLGTYDDNLVLDCETNSKSAFDVMNSYIEKNGRPPEAIFVSSDSVVSGMVKAIVDNGFSIPDDVGIVTYNNTMMSEQCNPALDSIEVYMKENAESAALSLEQMWDGKRLPRKIVVPCSLVVHGSVKKKRK